MAASFRRTICTIAGRTICIGTVNWSRSPVALNPLRQLYRDPAARLDRLAQQLVTGRLLRARRQRGVAMGGFVGAKILDPLFQRRVPVFQRRDLRGVMFVD